MKSTVRRDYFNHSLIANQDSLHIRSSHQWTNYAKVTGARSGQAAARSWAAENGKATILWDDGHTTVFSMISNELHRARFYPSGTHHVGVLKDYVIKAFKTVQARSVAAHNRMCDILDETGLDTFDAVYIEKAVAVNMDALRSGTQF